MILIRKCFYVLSECKYSRIRSAASLCQIHLPKNASPSYSEIYIGDAGWMQPCRDLTDMVLTWQKFLCRHLSQFHLSFPSVPCTSEWRKLIVPQLMLWLICNTRQIGQIYHQRLLIFAEDLPICMRGGYVPSAPLNSYQLSPAFSRSKGHYIFLLGLSFPQCEQPVDSPA